MFTTDPSTSVVQAAYSALEAKGAVALSESQFVSAIQSVPLATRQQFYSIVNTNGLAYYHAQMIVNLQTLATEVASMHNGAIYLTAGCHVPIVAIGAAYFGIVALAVTGPVGWAIGAIAAVSGRASLFGLLGGC
ncbi:MAG: hypothetical protein ABSB66_02595 [Candidatus Acidiferrales bacterium]